MTDAAPPSPGDAPRVLIVTAVAPERDAVAGAFTPLGGRAEAIALPGGYELVRTTVPPDSPDGSPAGPDLVLDAVAGGVGPAAAASCAATALTAAGGAGEPYALVVSAGIGGGFGTAGDPGAPVSTVLADSIVAADLGAQTGSGFAAVTELGFGTTEHRPPEGLVRALGEATGAVSGTVLTVSTATGTAGRADELATRHPGAAAEAMEGFGVAEAASAHGVPILEIRTVSNRVGPRDRDAWRIPEALAALRTTCAQLVPVLRTWAPWET
jgi:futalosine hydrolase